MLLDNLFRTWVHAHEEDTGDQEVFRPQGHRLPVSRGRAGFEVHPDGHFVDHRIGAGGGIKRVVGTWEADQGGTVRISFPDGARRFQIVALDDDQLILRRVQV